MRKGVYIFVCVLLITKPLCAQEACSIYNTVMDSFYKIRFSININTPSKIDPMNLEASWRNLDDTSPIYYLSKYKLLIEDHLFKLDSQLINDWFSPYFKDSVIVKNTQLYDDFMLPDCKLNDSLFCYEYISKSQAVQINYDIPETCTIQDSILLYKEKVVLSNLLFINDREKVYVILFAKRVPARRMESIYLFELINKRGIWVISKIGNLLG